MEYHNCWFEITDIDGNRMMLTKDHAEFMTRSETFSHLHDIMLYRIERSANGFVRTRIFGETAKRNCAAISFN